MASQRRPKSWTEKFAAACAKRDLPRAVEFCPSLAAAHGPGTLLVPSPAEVLELMGQVPPGQLTTIGAIAAALARRHDATLGCPITTGIFAWLAANAAAEDAAAGVEPTLAWWRTLKSNGDLNPKYPGGCERQAALLAREGHRVTPARGKKPPRVEGFAAVLTELRV